MLDNAKFVPVEDFYHFKLNGSLYLLAPVDKTDAGCVFVGEGTYTLTPATAGEQHQLRINSGDDELTVLRRERKRRLEAAGAYRDAGRDDLAQGEQAEAELISAYLPAELSDAELRTIVEQAVADSGAESAKDMGVAMKHAMAAVDGRADGKRVSGLVRVSLQA